MQDSEYQRQSECEDYEDYGVDGYHPVTLGEKFNHTYIVVQKLGWGHFSTVWLVQHETNKEYYALKIQRSKDNHAQSALDQLQLLNGIKKHQKNENWLSELQSLEKVHSDLINSKLCEPLVMIDNFAHFGIHGKHYCTVFQILGPNLLDLIQHYEFKEKRMPLWLVKKITIDVLLGLLYLHSYCDIIHTDLKPENIMIKLESNEEKQLISNIKKYKVKPISMKYLKALQASKNSKTKKKNQKKRLKKKQKQAEKEDKEEKEQKEDGEDKQDKEDNHHKQIKEEEKYSDKNQQKKSQSNQNHSSSLSAHSTPLQIKQEKQRQEKEKPEKEKEERDNKKSSQVEQQIDMSVLKWKNVKIQLNKKLFFKIVDMGNACFSDNHFTDGIQTREYRAPQVILGYPYTENTDIWSLGCTVFEMLTNNFLFKPKRIEGISKDEDHLYKIIEVLGPMNKEYALNGRYSDKYFNKKGKLLHGHPKQQVKIHELLHEDYDYCLQDAVEIEQFLLPMLDLNVDSRISARDCLKAQWLWK